MSQSQSHGHHRRRSNEITENHPWRTTDYNSTGKDLNDVHRYLTSNRPTNLDLRSTRSSKAHQDAYTYTFDEAINLQYSMWQPVWLRKTTLIGFAILFTLLCIALLILWHFSLVQNGISQHFTHNRYASTYGPTAILVIVVCLWRQVDYHCKSLSPWHNLAKGPKTSAHTVLLDYVSPIQVTALYRAIKLRNFAVVLSVTGFTILKLAVVASTGLLLSQPTPLIDNYTQITLVTKFDALAYNATLDPDLQMVAPTSDTTEQITRNDIFANPVYVYYGVEHGGMTQQQGTTSGVTYPLFDRGGDKRNATRLTVNVDTFVPITSCEVAEVNFHTDPTVFVAGRDSPFLDDEFFVNINTPTCQLPNHKLWGCLSTECNAREVYPARRWTNCSLAPNLADIINPDRLIYNASVGDFRWVISLAEVQYVQSWNSSIHNLSTLVKTTRTIAAVTAVVCKIDYSMVRAPLTYHYISDGTLDIKIDIAKESIIVSHLPGLTSSQLNQAVSFAIADTGGLLDAVRPPQKDVAWEDIFFDLMSLPEWPRSSYESFFDGNVLKTSAESVYNRLSQYFAQAYLMYPDNTTGVGSLSYTEYRLHVGEISLWLMVGCFATMTVLCLALLFARPTHVVPRGVDGIGAMAALLQCANSVYESALSSLGNTRQSVMKEHLRRYVFKTSMSNRFEIIAISNRHDEDIADPTLKQNKTKLKQWYPWPTRYPMLAVNFVTPLLVIVALELLQRKSDNNNGITTITSGAAESAYQYVTSLIMLMVATLFNNLDFTITSFTPFSTLRNGSCTTHRTLTLHLTGYMPPMVLWKAAKTLQIGALLSTSAGLVGSMLAILASGLWFLDPGTLTKSSIVVQRLDTWNASLFNSSKDGGASLTFSMIAKQNLTYPAWTFDELAFPQIAHSFTDPTFAGSYNTTGDHSNTARLQFDVLALRANLNCTVLDPDQISMRAYRTTIPGGNIAPIESVVVSIPLSPYCAANTNDTPGFFNSSMTYIGWDPTPDVGLYMGTMFDVETLYNRTSATRSSDSIRCPSLGFIYGYLRVNSTPIENVTAMVCYQEIQEVKTSTTWVQSFSDGVAKEPVIEPLTPPSVDESSVQLLANASSGSTAFEWRITTSFNHDIQRNNDTGAVNVESGGSRHQNRAFEAIFDSVLRNVTGGWAPKDFIGPKNAEKLMKAINHSYRQYMAQAISLNMRTPLNGSSTAVRSEQTTFDDGANLATSFSGTAYSQIPRLKMDSTIKLVVQIALATMILCGVTALFCVKIRGTLSHNPYTIAGTMSLLAGSELCDRLPPGSEWLDDEELEQFLSRHGWLYSLGWWNTDTMSEHNIPNKRFGIDIGRAEWI